MNIWKRKATKYIHLNPQTNMSFRRKSKPQDLEASKDLTGIIPKSYFSESKHSLAIFFMVVELLLKTQHILSGSIFFSSVLGGSIFLKVGKIRSPFL